MNVPTLETERLILRAHTGEDYPHACAMWSDPLVTRFVGGRASTPQQTWSRLLAYLGHWQVQGYGYWAVEEKSSGSFIGEAGFADFKRDIVETMRNAPEIGFAFVSSAHGKGYATEAVRAILQWADAHLQSPRTVCMVSEENAASLHIVQSAGYRPFSRTAYNESPVVFLERTAPGGRQ